MAHACLTHSGAPWPPTHPPTHPTTAPPPPFPGQVVEKTREARQQLEEFRQRQELGSDDDEEYDSGGKRSTPAALRTRKRRQAKQGERLESAAVDNVSQLRLACIHPQVGRLPSRRLCPIPPGLLTQGLGSEHHPGRQAAHQLISSPCAAPLCVQLTRVWRDMQAEAQLGIGATLSMEEIMQRLVENAQNDLQVGTGAMFLHVRQQPQI